MVVSPAQAHFRGRRRGDSLVQLLVALGIIVVLVALLLPMATRVRSSSRSVTCLSHLRAISTSFSLYANDNGGLLPYPAFTEVPWERSLSKYAPVSTFECPGDQELAVETGSSYDWRDTGIAETTLAGEGMTGARSDAALAFDALPSWHESGQANVVRVDGAAISLTADELVADLNKPVRRP